MDTYRVPDIAKKYTEYDIIQTHTELPDFPNYRARLLYAFLNKGSSSANSELYVLVTSLVQMGLDTHDLVSASKDRSERNTERSRQLKVLAGDYFSSRFYHLLSQAGQIELVKQLSDAVCEVNRLKMNMYLKMKQFKLTADDYIQQSVHIKTQLFLAFSGLMEGIYNKVWPDMLHGLTRCEVIHEELKRLDTLNKFRDSFAYWHILQLGSKEEKKHLSGEETDSGKIRSMTIKYNVRSLLFQMLHQQLQQVLQKFQQFESEQMMKELFHIVEPFMRCLSTPKVLEGYEVT